MKLSNAVWGHPNRRVMEERSERMWSTGEGNGKPLQYSCLENPMNCMKMEKDRTLNDELPMSVGHAPSSPRATTAAAVCYND